MNSYKNCKEKSTANKNNVSKATKHWAYFLASTVAVGDSIPCCSKGRDTGPIDLSIDYWIFFCSSHIVRNFLSNMRQDTSPGQKSLYALIVTTKWLANKNKLI